MKNWKIRSLLCFSTSGLENYQGLVMLFQILSVQVILQHCEEFHRWTEEEISMVEDVATHVATAIVHAHLNEVEKAKEVAEKANAVKLEFLAVVSHEVRYRIFSSVLIFIFTTLERQ